MSNKEHVLFCIMAESAAGKDGLISMMCERERFSQLISFTTRPRRENEGNTHVFVDNNAFIEMKENNEIAAYTNINSNHYWSTIDQLYASDFYAIDPLGVQSLRALNLPNLRLVTIYINVPEDVRRERARTRGDDMNVYRNRCLSERQQFRDMKKNMDVDYVIPNLDFATAYSCLKHIASIEGLWKNRLEDTTE